MELPRWSLAALSAFIAGVCAWAAYVLPWREGTGFALAASTLALAHLVTAVLALVGHRARASAWRVQSWLAFAFVGYVGWIVIRSAVYVAELYGSLGQGVAAALALVGFIVVALLVPVALWGLVATGGLPRRNRAFSVGAVVIVVIVAACGDLVFVTRVAAADPVAGFEPAELTTMLSEVSVALPAGDEPVPVRGVLTCEQPPGREVVTVAAAYAPYGTRCIQAATMPDAVVRLADHLREHPPVGPVKVDVVTATQALATFGAVIDAVALRPGLDGVCFAQRCLMPWQLVARGVFGRYQPIPVIADLRFGVAWGELVAELAPKLAPDEPRPRPLRIETSSYVLRDTGLVALERTRLPVDDQPQLDARRLRAALEAAQNYILAAIGDDGRFAYRVDPFTGRAFYRGFALPRQAGTTLALCELALDRERVRPVVQAALTMLASTEHRVAQGSFLAYPPNNEPEVAHLGSTALAAIAFARCRDLVDDAFDPVLARLVTFLLEQQRPDGGFHARYDTRAAAAQPGADALYAAGQAVFALVLAERIADEDPEALAPLGHEQLRDAVERAMDYFAEDYWPKFVRDFFFVEENWHCLAARAALTHHRHRGYERFCRDYVRFKRRLILDEGVAPELVGGYGFGNVLPPHNTPTAGFAEALAAALAIDRADGRVSDRDVELMRMVLKFLLRHQWDEASCFACTGDRDIVGAWSEHVGSPTIRIDFVQHAMAALGHGGAMIGLR